MPYQQWVTQATGGIGHKLFVFASMLLEAVHTGLNKTLKVSSVCSSGSQLAPAFMTLCVQRRGQEAFGKTNTKQAISWSEVKLRLTFLLNSYQRKDILHKSSSKT